MKCFLGGICDKNPCEGLSLVEAEVCRYCSKISENQDLLEKFLDGLGATLFDIVEPEVQNDIIKNIAPVHRTLNFLTNLINERIDNFLQNIKKISTLDEINNWLSVNAWWIDFIYDKDILSEVASMISDDKDKSFLEIKIYLEELLNEPGRSCLFDIMEIEELFEHIKLENKSDE